MEIGTIAAFADILAAVGVIGSLIFLAVQVRKNTQTLRSQILESHLDRVAANYSRTLDANVATVIDKGKESYGDLSGPEKVIFNAWASEYLLNTNHLMIFTRDNLIDPLVGEIIDRRHNWFFKNRGMCQWWQDEDRHPQPNQFEITYTEKSHEMWPEFAK